jgi:hypothetical protein
MSMQRETYFHCTFASSGERRTAIIPAWDARMAESLFRELLEEEAEPREAGTIEVEAPGGELARRAAFDPRR